ncbi:hypothetical protein ACOMHN_042771 [Nucella lapillus]
MNTQSDISYNPWSSDDTAIGLKNAMMLAEKTGHVIREEGPQERLKTKLEETPSLRMIQLMKVISEKNEQLNKVNIEVQKRMLHHEGKDILDLGVIERRTEGVRTLADHLQMVIASKEVLITRLQRPHVGISFKLEATFHRYASEFFSQLAPVLSELSSHLDDLAWVSTNTFPTCRLDNLVTELSGTLASLETQFQYVLQMSSCIHQLQAATDSHNVSEIY